MTYPVYYACIGMVFPALNSLIAVFDLPASAKYETRRPAWEKERTRDIREKNETKKKKGRRRRGTKWKGVACS